MYNILKALYGDAMFPFHEHKYGRRKPTETSVFEFSYAKSWKFKRPGSRDEEPFWTETLFV